MKFSSSIMSLAMMVLSAGAAAAQDGGWYVSGGMGVIGMEDSHVSHTPPPAPANNYMIGHLLNAANFMAAFGFQMDGFRVENELSYANIPGNTYSPHGHTGVASDLVNVLYDIPLDDRWTFSPGLGVGVGQVLNSYAGVLKGTKTGVAWQAILGFSYLMAPDTDFFMDVHHREISGASYVSPTASLNPSSVSHAITDSGILGVRWFLGP